ncbi:efflux RND transporter periplasmic adaptor subunit [Hydrogenophaga palleronii]|uniref:efflux RND transporter periplasmic adaptor subunit n=1 Tax=Hydrogenophaga palleronii TaxID=65655 RepID=UPI0008240B1F|nr:efflux RND transporter periplasmic adaptor subunit [Hydrogenophaga palleronii]
MTDQPSGKRRRVGPALVLVTIAAAIVITGTVTRWSRAEQLRDNAESQAIRSVGVISPAPLDSATLELPARIEAWSRAPIHARVNGYLKRWIHDIGTPVKAGEILAEIDTPDSDQALLQARAELARARGEAALADTTAKRWQSLLASDAVSRQDVEERVADSAARRAVVDALQANVQRMQTLQQFKQLTAPFDGVITARNTDVGSLISGGAAEAPGTALFVVSDIRRLRIYVNVPQRQVASLRLGSKAQLTVPERPGETFEATVQSLSQAIDVNTGSMRVQLMADNVDGKLLPGGFARVRFVASESARALGLPPSALILGRAGVQVALVDDQGRVRLRTVTIGRDLGRIVELNDGVDQDDRVINSPPDGIADGDPVRVAGAPGAAAK